MYITGNRPVLSGAGSGPLFGTVVRLPVMLELTYHVGRSRRQLCQWCVSTGLTYRIGVP